MRRTNAPINIYPHRACLTSLAYVNHRCTHSFPNASTTGIFHASGQLLPNPISWGTLFARTFGLARCVSAPSREKKTFKAPTDLLSTANPFFHRSYFFLRHHGAVGTHQARHTIATGRNRYASREWWFMDDEYQTSVSWHGRDRIANSRELCYCWRSAQRGAKMSRGCNSGHDLRGTRGFTRDYLDSRT
jgi:hypothetical protein